MRPVKSPPRPLVTRSPVRAAGTAAHDWQKAYRRRLFAADALCGLVATVTVLAAPVGTHRPGVPMALLMPLVWVAALGLGGCYERRLLWTGPDEFRRVIRAGAMLLVTVGSVAWGLDLPLSRDSTAPALLLMCLVTLVQRYGHRRWLCRQRALGRAIHRALLVGDDDRVAAFHQQLRQESHHGYRAVGCCLARTDDRSLDGLPVLGGLDDVVRVVEIHDIDCIAVLSAPGSHGGAPSQLGRVLEHTRADLLVAPALTELAGPRITFRPCSALPLMHVERPELRGADRLLKGAFDRGVALLTLMTLLPALTAIAMAVKATSPGPVFTREEKIGRGGRTFEMSTFRTTVDDAVGQSGDGVLVALRRGPQVTPVGHFLRRHCLDQLPKLLDVLCGRISLVGPHPLHPRDVDRPRADPDQSPLAEPGLTGLRHMGNRSDVERDDRVHLEVRYVENWSLALDLTILARTLRTALRSERTR
jgi:lipopolysaccharide/colanic/teichoic acid biosynthesis glycosyltransferase